MKQSFFFVISCSILICSIGWIDRRLYKANHGFCLHVIEAPIPDLPDPNPDTTFPRDLFSQPFYYLGKGAQSFVFESADKSAVLKFYRFPSHLRRFPWLHHPWGYLFSRKRQHIKAYNLRRLELSFHSFFLATDPLQHETEVLYTHLHPTSHLHQKVKLIDRLGSTYHVPLDSVMFIVQKKGAPFLSVFKQELFQGNLKKCQAMIDSLIDLIRKRCHYQITDLDNMDHDNYGWLEDRAIHLDIGRFQEKETLNDPSQIREEIVRVTSPLTDYLLQTSPELYSYFFEKL